MQSQCSPESAISSEKTVRVVLLVTPVNLQSNGIGALFLRDVMSTQPETAFLTHEEPPFLMGGRQGRMAMVFRAIASRIPIIQLARLILFRKVFLESRAATIAALADEMSADCIWMTASSPEMIWIGEQLTAAGRDVRVTVWDAPEYLAGNLRLPVGIRQALFDAFGNFIRRARSVSVISKSMHISYLERYGVKSEIIRHGVEQVLPERQKEQRAPGALRVVFAGSLYSKEEWNSFVSAMEAANWQISGSKIELYFIGHFPLTGAIKPSNIVLMGEMLFDNALQVMATMDIAYLPYWFDPRHEVEARTSFPGKLSAYAAAGLPIYHHAPAYTEVTTFLQDFPFGIACSSLNATEIINTFSRLIIHMDTDLCMRAREVALQGELSQAIMSQRFSRFLSSNHT